MSPEQWQRVKGLFDALVEQSAAERAARLRGEPDAEVAAAAAKLLAADDAAAGFEDAPAVANLAHLWRDDDTDEMENFVGRRVGNYTIIREIGRGGMGVVFEAARAGGDFSQSVALKLLKRGMDSAAMLRRFRAERQILASLEHPNIAHLLDGGMSEDGLPFFALELVEGEPLDKYCQSRNLNVGERLRLFRRVCAAVSFAHSRLVVHRDLKPTNVLVTPDGTPKLLDFGIAKILAGAGEIAPEATVTRLGMMTPQYASPEQARGGIAATASDVYSLGLILYELLTNRPPYEFVNNRPDEIARVICEVEPAAPSSVVTTERQRWRNADAGATNENEAAATDDYSPRRYSKSDNRNAKLLRGDLDNIVLKALRKEPNRRYASVEQFSEDIRRHLGGLPVSARPTTVRYRFEKFVSRNRAVVASGILLFLTLCGGIAATSWQAVRAERQRVLAEKRFNQVRSLAGNVVFKYHDGIANLQGSTEVRKMLVRDATEYLDNLAQDAGGDPELLRELANAYTKLADVQGKPYYSNVGDTGGALENYRKAVAMLEKIAASALDIKTKAQAETDLTLAYQTLGMMQTRTFAHADSIASQQKALALVEARAAAAPGDDAVQYLLVRARGRLADSMREGGQFDEAIEIYRRALALDEEIFRRSPENENVETALAVLNDRIGRNLALRAIDLKRIGAPLEKYADLFAEAEARMNRMFSGFERLVAAHPEKKKYRRDLSTAYGNLGMILRETGRLEAARALHDADLEKRETVAALDPLDRESQADLSEALAERAQTAAAQKNFARAFADFARAVAVYDRLIDADAGNIEFRRLRFETENYYADALATSGDAEKALDTYRAAFEKLKKDAPAANPYFVFAAGASAEKIGDVYARQKKSREAVAAYRKTLEFWNQPGAAAIELSRCPERIERVREKLFQANQPE